jgi:hypothetical protein
MPDESLAVDHRLLDQNLLIKRLTCLVAVLFEFKILHYSDLEDIKSFKAIENLENDESLTKYTFSHGIGLRKQNALMLFRIEAHWIVRSQGKLCLRRQVLSEVEVVEIDSCVPGQDVEGVEKPEVKTPLLAAFSCIVIDHQQFFFPGVEVYLPDI